MVNNLGSHNECMVWAHVRPDHPTYIKPNPKCGPSLYAASHNECMVWAHVCPDHHTYIKPNPKCDSSLYAASHN